jgi:hypothetical protein
MGSILFLLLQVGPELSLGLKGTAGRADDEYVILARTRKVHPSLLHLIKIDIKALFIVPLRRTK